MFNTPDPQARRPLSLLLRCCCCCSTQRTHTPDPQARGPLSLWTEVWPTHPAITQTAAITLTYPHIRHTGRSPVYVKTTLLRKRPLVLEQRDSDYCRILVSDTDICVGLMSDLLCLHISTLRTRALCGAVAVPTVPFAFPLACWQSRIARRPAVGVAVPTVPYTVPSGRPPPTARNLQLHARPPGATLAGRAGAPHAGGIRLGIVRNTTVTGAWSFGA